MSALDLPTRRSRAGVQLETKQRQIVDKARGKQDASSPGWVTPRNKKEKAIDASPRPPSLSRHVSAPAAGSSEQRLSPGRGPFLKSGEFAYDKTRDSKRRKPDSRRLSQTAIRHVSDGPVLQTKQKWLSPPPLNAEWSNGIHDSLTYAQAATSLQGQTEHIQVAPFEAAIERRASQQAPTTPSLIIETPLTKQDSVDNESEAPPSIFDEDHGELDRLSDFATEISSSTLSDNGLPPDIDPDERLVHPKKYLDELQSLEAHVAGNSALFLMKQANRQDYPVGDCCELRFGFDCFSPEGRTLDAKSYDDLIWGLHRKNPSDENALLAFHLLECRNLMLAVISNIERMKAARFCQKSINVLTVNQARPQVARLVDLSFDAILRLHKALETAVEKIADVATSQDFQIGPKLNRTVQKVDSECDGLLLKLRLPAAQTQVSAWRKAIMILDLAVVSYCGAHIERFDEKFLAEDLDLAKITTAWSYDRLCTEGIMLRRRRLRCLDGFLGGQQVWVLQSQALWQDSRDLYLSAEMDQFADIWGPVWAVRPSEDSDLVLKFNAGPGSISPLPVSQDSPPTEEGEIFCHWFRHDDEPVEPLSGMPSRSRLLIGAGSVVEQTTSQLKENELCRNHRFAVLQQLRQANCVEELGTRRPTTYVAENQVTAQVGAYGVALGGSRVYKRQHGISLKEAITEAWRHGGGERNPALLEQWLGVEVSFCSKNARRRRLKQILNSTTMRNWLDACRNRDLLPCDHAFDDALQSSNPRAFRDLYLKHKEWRKDLGQLVSWCLEGLLHSNVDADRVFRVLWAPRPEQRYRIKLRHNPHSWTGLLIDTEDMCSMGIMSGRCLHTDYKDASVCQVQGAQPGRLNSTVLETAVTINEAAPRPRGLERKPSGHEKSKQAQWSVSRIPRDEKFVLESCRLRVIECFARTRVLVQWEAGVMNKIHNARQQVARTIGKETLHHWELKSEEDWPTKPIPLFVVSQFKNKL
ncbi:MAG: hypothetical protein M1822_006981 [Bathelium mastoideum]|nr:MAG: hypothetical protein M1822_006981 [Bathelium mastoideum]